MQREERKEKRDEPLFIVVANEKGGQGKSVVSLAIADYAHVHDAPLGIAQIDCQARLANTLGRKVLTVNTVAAKSRRDPGAEARVFTPFYTLLEKAAGRGDSILLDCGANQLQRFSFWAGLVDLQEDLEDWGFKMILAVPFVAEAEGIRQAGDTVRLVQDRLSKAQLVLIENERDGGFCNQHPASDAAQAYQKVIKPLQSQSMTLRMPAIEAGSWRAFEAANSRFVDVVGMPIEKVMKVTGLPRPEAKIARGDVAAWAGGFFMELDRALPWNLTGGSDV